MLLLEMEISRELERVGCGIVLSRPAPRLRPKAYFGAFGPIREENRKALHKIIEEVAERHNLGLLDILSKDRRRHVVLARNEAIRTVARVVGWSRSCGNWANNSRISSIAIGKLFNKDHTTVLYVLGRVRAKAPKDYSQ